MESEKLLDPSERATDMDNHIIECYQLQDRFLIGKICYNQGVPGENQRKCRAEAQEVTIARAVMLKHKPSLIAALAMSTRDFFSDADKEPFQPF